MSSPELDNLVKIGKLKLEPPGDLAMPMRRVLAKAHERRNAIEYQGYIERDERLLAELIGATRTLREVVDRLKKA